MKRCGPIAKVYFTSFVKSLAQYLSVVWSNQLERLPSGIVAQQEAVWDVAVVPVLLGGPLQLGDQQKVMGDPSHP